LVTASLLAMVGIGLTGPVRLLLALAFVTFVPGWALLGVVPPLELTAGEPGSAAGRVPLVQGISKVAMAVAVSLTLCTLSAQALLWLRVWNPSALLGALGGLSLLTLATRFLRPSTHALPAAVPGRAAAGPS
ncbi:MAG: hypothetical protein QOJ69_1615, partial [Actinomycetota bacterium]|nr:hypothetical protein [Actinomycetota bacterium]